MSDEKICPVVAQYIYSARCYWQNTLLGARPLYGLFSVDLSEFEESPLASVRDYTTQRLRAFCCLNGLFVLLRTRMGGPSHQLPLTREGIQSLIKFCSTTRDAAEVKVYVDHLSGGSPASPLIQAESDTVINLTNTVIQACEYLRPRLATEGPLAGMGRLYVDGLACVRAPSDSFIKRGRELLHVPVASRKELGQ